MTVIGESAAGEILFLRCPNCGHKKQLGGDRK